MADHYKLETKGGRIWLDNAKNQMTANFIDHGNLDLVFREVVEQLIVLLRGLTRKSESIRSNVSLVSTPKNLELAKGYYHHCKNNDRNKLVLKVLCAISYYTPFRGFCESFMDSIINIEEMVHKGKKGDAFQCLYFCKKSESYMRQSITS